MNSNSIATWLWDRKFVLENLCAIIESHATSSHMAGNFTPALIGVWSTFVSPFCSLATSHAGCLYSFLQDWAYVTFPPAMTSIRVTTRRWSRATCVCCTPRNMLHWSYLSSPSRPFWHGVKSAQGSFQTFSITQTQSSTTNFAFARQSNISEREDAPKFGHGSRGCMGNLFARKASYEIWFPASSLSSRDSLLSVIHGQREDGLWNVLVSRKMYLEKFNASSVWQKNVCSFYCYLWWSLVLEQKFCDSYCFSNQLLQDCSTWLDQREE